METNKLEKYNNLISYDRVQTCFNTQLAKYYDGSLSFDKLLTEIDRSIQNSI